MKATEVRYGNWIKCDSCQDKTPFQVDFHTFESDYGTGCFETSYSGIPITEEWLLKLGFTNKTNRKNDVMYTHLSTGSHYDVVFQNNKYYWRVHGDYAVHVIKYVHQLQNIFFVLVDRELTIEE